MFPSLPAANRSIENKNTNKELEASKDILKRYQANLNWISSLTSTQKRNIEYNITKMVEAFEQSLNDLILFKLKRFKTINIPDFVEYINFQESLKVGYNGWKLVHVSNNIVELSTIERTSEEIKRATAFKTLINKIERNKQTERMKT